MERLQDRFRKAHTQVLGVSIDSKFSHGGWADSLGGISFPLLADFHPKGKLAQDLGVYLEEAGITDRATVIIDANGVVKHASAVTPAGERNIEELAALCEKVDGEFDGELPERPAPGKIEGDVELFVKSRCGFSTWALHARTNLHLEDALPVTNISEDAAAKAALEKAAGKSQAPCLRVGDTYHFESADIISDLVSKVAPI